MVKTEMVRYHKPLRYNQGQGNTQIGPKGVYTIISQLIWLTGKRSDGKQEGMTNLNTLSRWEGAAHLNTHTWETPGVTFT